MNGVQLMMNERNVSYVINNDSQKVVLEVSDAEVDEVTISCEYPLYIKCNTKIVEIRCAFDQTLKEFFETLSSVSFDSLVLTHNRNYHSH